MDRQGILLESGTNEMEFVEFHIGRQWFGVNVAKVQQMVEYNPKGLTRVPMGHDSLLGLLSWQGRTVRLINLRSALGIEEKAREGSRSTVLVTEFNDECNGFLVDGVDRIHRISWDRISPADPLLRQFNAPVLGSVNVNKRELFIIDLEQLVTEIDPANSDPETAEDQETAGNRAGMHLVLAEDSAIILKNVTNLLIKAGFGKITSFCNGQEALDYLSVAHSKAESEGQPLSKFVSCVVADIEMPQMDGLTLCKRLKSELKARVPVVIFSSLVNTQMASKCESVGADGCVGKARIDQLIETLDSVGVH